MTSVMMIVNKTKAPNGGGLVRRLGTVCCLLQHMQHESGLQSSFAPMHGARHCPFDFAMNIASDLRTDVIFNQDVKLTRPHLQQPGKKRSDITFDMFA